MKIMVVDDERVIADGVAQHLRQMEGIELTVTAAYSGKEALANMECFRPDLLITDIRMPGMDGLALIAEARRRSLCGAYIILTAYEEFEYARQAVENRALSYLVKPIDWDALEERILRLSDDQQARVSAEEVIQSFAHLYAHIDRDGLSQPLMRVISFIRTNYTKNVSLSQLSAHAELSENYICFLFKKELGITYLDYVVELRLKKAMTLLLTEKNRAISDIALRVGYQSDRQFFRLFHDRLGLSPQKFRSLNAAN